jgi:DNA-binding CsgD family transcriptional regulator
VTLTARQSEALRLLASGLRDKEIAASMGVTLNTVKALLMDARARLGMLGATRVELASAYSGGAGNPGAGAPAVSSGRPGTRAARAEP